MLQHTNQGRKVDHALAQRGEDAPADGFLVANPFAANALDCSGDPRAQFLRNRRLHELRKQRQRFLPAEVACFSRNGGRHGLVPWLHLPVSLGSRPPPLELREIEAQGSTSSSNAFLAAGRSFAAVAV